MGHIYVYNKKTEYAFTLLYRSLPDWFVATAYKNSGKYSIKQIKADNSDYTFTKLTKKQLEDLKVSLL